ncbi:MAG: shikimate kinase [Propionibacteriaceae bacterium]|jgi:shikimate kinase|nr:shikimate kinase [Propionibacteriaceae bacterium]
MSVVLVGMPAAGKTTVGKLLAAKLGLPFVDLDERIEADTGVSVTEIFATAGEGAFRELEAQTAAVVLAGTPIVLSLGGGAVTNPKLREVINAHSVVWLQVSLATALERVGDTRHRPLLADNPAERLRVLLNERGVLYAQVAQVVVSTDAVKPSAVVERIVAALREGNHHG